MAFSQSTADCGPPARMRSEMRERLRTAHFAVSSFAQLTSGPDLSTALRIVVTLGSGPTVAPSEAAQYSWASLRQSPTEARLMRAPRTPPRGPARAGAPPLR